MGLPSIPGGSRVRTGSTSGADMGQWGGMGSAGGATPMPKGGNSFTGEMMPTLPSKPGDMLAKGGGANYANTLGTLTGSNGSASAGIPASPLNKIPGTPSVDPATGNGGGQFNNQQFTPGGANNMFMPGAGITSQGIAGYTKGNGPLDLSRFTPEGGSGQAWYNHLFGQNNPNSVSYLGFVDALGRNALGGRQNWSDQGAIADQLNYMNSDAGQTWLKGLMGIQDQPAQQNAPPPGGGQQQTPPPGGNNQQQSVTPTQDPGQIVQNAQDSFQDPKSVMNAMLSQGVQPRDIPIQIRLMAQGIQPQTFGPNGSGMQNMQNPFLNMMQNGMGNPFMRMMMAMGGGQ